MDITLSSISKRYGARWIFKDVNYNFKEGGAYALTGGNGSGKSTLLNILVGKIPFSQGKITYSHDGGKYPVDEIFKKFSIATTSMSLIEEFTLNELLNFHFRFRSPVMGIAAKNVPGIIELEKEGKKFVGDFSSGMKQRVKIGLALLSSSEVVILDEPGANLDVEAKAWYQKMLATYLQGRMVIIASNDPEDYVIAREYLDISDFAG